MSGSYNPGGQVPRFGLFRFRSPLLTESFHFLFLRLLRCFTSPGVAPAVLCVRAAGTGHDSSRVTPFGNPRVIACLPLTVAYRSFPRPSSPIGTKASIMHSFYLCKLYFLPLLCSFQRAPAPQCRPPDIECLPARFDPPLASVFFSL